MTSSPAASRIETLRAHLATLPNEPGVYRFLDPQGEPLYVGKAKNLRRRVSSYLRPRATLHGRTAEMLRQAVAIEWVATASESEALLLEDNFVKESRPPYNLRLRDDKSYPYIEITLSDEWPRVRMFRGRHRAGHLYFGPYASARAVRETLDVLGRLFPFRKCKGPQPGRPSGSPCLQYSIKRSLAPCVGYTSKEEYRAVIDQVIDFLRGRLSSVERGIRDEMRAAARACEYEKAALLRDRLAAVQNLREEQTARLESSDSLDVIGIHQDDPGANVQVFRLRDGAVVDRRSFAIENAAGREADEVLEEFLLEYYWDGSFIPAEVIAPMGESESLAEALSTRRGAGVSVRNAQRGPKRRLLELARHNAELAAQLEATQAQGRESARITALERLRDVLQLAALPLRIECYDISNLGEEYPVASMVVFEAGRPKKAHYRKFAIRDAHGQDDFAMMNQVIRRRFERRAVTVGDDEYDESFAALPDLVVIDGGKGQLGAAVAAAAEAGAEINVVGLAKQREEVFVPGQKLPLPLAADDPGSLLLQHVRDEAHRFALRYHRQRRDAGVHGGSVFAELPQVGPVRRRRLLEHFGSPERFLAASRDELERVPGLPARVGREIFAHLHKAG